jgi:hypothetical protein
MNKPDSASFGARSARVLAARPCSLQVTPRIALACRERSVTITTPSLLPLPHDGIRDCPQHNDNNGRWPDASLEARCPGPSGSIQSFCGKFRSGRIIFSITSWHKARLWFRFTGNGSRPDCHSKHGGINSCIQLRAIQVNGHRVHGQRALWVT